MDIETNAAIKYFFPNPSIKFVYFEAIANAFDANASAIEINIKLLNTGKTDSLKIEISDNGDGFNDENYNRFKTLLKPRDSNHKGVGRLVYLNYFNKVSIRSTWPGHSRSFIFDEKFTVTQNDIVTEDANLKEQKTTLLFENHKNTRIRKLDDITPENLKTQIIQHFLPKLTDFSNTGLDFSIKINLDPGDSKSQKDLYRTSTTITKEDLPKFTTVTIAENKQRKIPEIKIHYHITTSVNNPNFFTAVCVDGRTIEYEIINKKKIPKTHNIIFLIECDEIRIEADSSRQRIIFGKNESEGLLKASLQKEIGSILNKQIPEIERTNKEAKAKFQKYFPHLEGYFEEPVAGLIDEEESLQKAQLSLFDAQRGILMAESLTDEAYNRSIELSSRTLTEYILYRQQIIKKIKEKNESNNESEIHNLIVPMKQVLNGADIVGDLYQNNAWLLDEKFMTFKTILSDKKMEDVITAITTEDECKDEGRPDIALIFSADPDKNERVDVVIVEIKKKTNDKKENIHAITQLTDRMNLLAEHCPNIQRMWYYAIIEIDIPLAKTLKANTWVELYSKGRVFYRELKAQGLDDIEIPAPTFIASYESLIKDAEARNNTFLEILKSGIRNFCKKENEQKNITDAIMEAIN